MTEIPEHLLKRAREAREKAEGTSAPAEPAAAEPAAAEPPAAAAPAEPAADTGDSRIPAHLLERSRAAKQKAEGGGDEPTAPPAAGGVAVADRVTSVVQATPTAAGVPVGAGPGGHTQRLLTVVKSGSIQDVKAQPIDKVHTWPHLLAAEFVAALACTLFTFLFSIWVNAPLLQHSNINQTPNPSKAPWYFLGLQELLTMFHPMIAGVTIPGVGLIVLIFAPYIDKNPSNKPEDRKFATSLMTVHIMFWAVLVLIGSFFRGPGFNFVLPWKDGLFFDL
jgi:quinol---cytochrome c reductase cytochrome c subunit, bacillus type